MSNKMKKRYGLVWAKTGIESIVSATSVEEAKALVIEEMSRFNGRPVEIEFGDCYEIK